MRSVIALAHGGDMERWEGGIQRSSKKTQKETLGVMDMFISLIMMYIYQDTANYTLNGWLRYSYILTKMIEIHNTVLLDSK